MEKIYIAATQISPEITLDIENNIFAIKGKSVVTEVDSFYAPILNWLDDSGHLLADEIDFVLDIEYFNIFSSKRILFILYKLAEISDTGSKINIIWNFSIDDDDMKEVGEDFACMVNLPFQFASKSQVLELI